MTRKATNKLLQQAKKLKKDEFYTQLCDIENELKHYKKHFKNKIVYCNTDDPRTSNFYKYFALNFNELGLKKIIASCHKIQDINLFNQTEYERGFYYEYTGKKDEKIIPNSDDVIYFNGDGDFRSPESIELLKQSDIIVTNPPFSLFREFTAQLIKYDKKFLVIANINAITYKEIFNLIKGNKIWLGINFGRGISGFIVPEYYELYGTETHIDKFGNRIVSPNNALWLTNLDNFKRHEDIILTKKYYENETEYPKYDNYDAINIDRTKDIPLDFEGHMGVPITFLHKYNPEQFEIIKFRKGNDGKDLSINGKCPYFRIIIKNKKVANRIYQIKGKEKKITNNKRKTTQSI